MAWSVFKIMYLYIWISKLKQAHAFDWARRHRRCKTYSSKKKRWNQREMVTFRLNKTNTWILENSNTELCLRKTKTREDRIRIWHFERFAFIRTHSSRRNFLPHRGFSLSTLIELIYIYVCIFAFSQIAFIKKFVLTHYLCLHTFRISFHSENQMGWAVGEEGERKRTKHVESRERISHCCCCCDVVCVCLCAGF